MTLLFALLQEEHVASPFDINGGVIIWTVVIFVILLALLWRLGDPSLLRMVEERERRVPKQPGGARKADAEGQRLREGRKKHNAPARNHAAENPAKEQNPAPE